MKNLTFGICQGRLLRPPNNQLQWFPGEKWSEEFSIAKLKGYKYIELLAERKHNSNNPIWSAKGINKIKEKIHEFNLIPYSICLDYIIENPLVNNSTIIQSNLYYILDFLEKIAPLNLKLVVIPLLEASEINYEDISLFIDILNLISKKAAEFNLKIAIESIGSTDLLIKLVDAIDLNNTGIVYDTGNRALISINPLKEIKELGSRINHIHLKDVRKPFGNVPIGSGTVDFLGILKTLTEIKYQGFFSFESNRGENPSKTGSHNINYIEYIHSLV